MSESQVWERERVLALCPDLSSRVTAQQQAAPRRWASTGATERAVWGRCQGSARTPYETVVEVRDSPSSWCSCPSRRSPCKHALGLLLLWSAGDVPPAAAEADFAAARLRASAGSAAAASPPTAVADPEAAVRRAAARAERVAAGLDDLELWLRDQIRSGLAGLERTGYLHFERVAARMVDAQAPGVASMLRAIPAELSVESWPGRVLERLAALHLLIQAHRRLDQLPPELAANVRSRVGYPMSRAQVLATPAVRDTWVALGLVDTVESQVETRRVWLYGTSTHRWAAWLSFAVPGVGLDTSVLPGQLVEGVLHGYPGSGFRVQLGELAPTGPELPSVPAESLTEVQQRFAGLLAADPWASRMPAVVAAAPVPPDQRGRRWRLRDADGHCVDLAGLTGEPWPLLARSGGEPVPVFGEWTPEAFRPLSALPDRWGSSFTVSVAA